MRVLIRLAAAPAEVVSVDQLMDDVWKGVIVTPNSLYQVVAELRRALGDDPKTPTYIANVLRRGYRLIAAVAPWDALPVAAADPPTARPSERMASAPVAAVPEEPRGEPAPLNSPGARRLTAPRQAPTRGWQRTAGIGIATLAVIVLGFVATKRLVLDQTASRASIAAVEKSIAVLPFVDMSEKKDQEYFSDGLTEELTGLLTRIPELHVAARTSAFYFKGKPATIAEIAKTLEVGNVLEGTVRKSGNTLRITAQLVQARNGYQLWSETYDRTVEDVFKTQDEIAGSVARALNVQLLAGPLPGRTENFEAYNLVLQGRYFGWQGDGQKALDCYQRAVELDPHYAVAWAWLAAEQNDPDWHAADPRARQSAQRAIALDPNLPDGHIAMAQVAFYYNFQLEEAEQELQRALALDPNNSYALAIKGQLASERGRNEEGLDLVQQAVRQEPFVTGAMFLLGETLRRAHRLAEAEAVDRHALSFAPNSDTARYELAMTLLEQGKTPQAVTELEQISAESRFRLGGLAIAYFAAARKADSDAALAELTTNPKGSAFWIAFAHAYRNEKDEAFKWIAIAHQEHEWVWGLKVDPLWSNLRDDPRYQDWLRKYNLA
jgi:TolB-like protein/DNA-binding winged helix-turn-helix (wHTH) protein/Flp pilus assembly protein TadD